MLQKLINGYRIFRRWLYLATLVAVWSPIVIFPYIARDQGGMPMLMSALAWLLALRVLLKPYFYLGLAEVVQWYERRTGRVLY